MTPSPTVHVMPKYAGYFLCQEKQHAIQITSLTSKKLKTHNTYLNELQDAATNFAHQSVFTGLGEYSCICEKHSIKPLVAPGEAAFNLINLPPVL